MRLGHPFARPCSLKLREDSLPERTGEQRAAGELHVGVLAPAEPLRQRLVAKVLRAFETKAGNCSEEDIRQHGGRRFLRDLQEVALEPRCQIRTM